MFTKQVLKDDSSVHFYTGFPNTEFLLAISEKLNLVLDNMKYYSRSKKNTANSYMHPVDKNKTGPSRKLPAIQEFVLTLVKLRSDMPEQFFADTFQTSISIVSYILHTWLNLLYYKLRF